MIYWFCWSKTTSFTTNVGTQKKTNISKKDVLNSGGQELSQHLKPTNPTVSLKPRTAPGLWKWCVATRPYWWQRCEHLRRTMADPHHNGRHQKWWHWQQPSYKLHKRWEIPLTKNKNSELIRFEWTWWANLSFWVPFLLRPLKRWPSFPMKPLVLAPLKVSNYPLAIKHGTNINHLYIAGVPSLKWWCSSLPCLMTWFPRW